MIDESKVKILEALKKPKTVTQLSKELKLSKATVSHHLKHLERLGFVKVVSTKLERNFIKKYYVSRLHNPEFILPHEKLILEDFELSRGELLRTLLRLLNVVSLNNSLLLKKVGFDVGYFAIAERVDDGLESLADLWEKLKLGKVAEVSKEKFVVEDCYNCAHLPATGKPYCKIDEGIIEGVLRKKSGEVYEVEEVKCWGTGYDVCEFRIRKLP